MSCIRRRHPGVAAANCPCARCHTTQAFGFFVAMKQGRAAPATRSSRIGVRPSWHVTRVVLIHVTTAGSARSRAPPGRHTAGGQPPVGGPEAPRCSPARGAPAKASARGKPLPMSLITTPLLSSFPPPWCLPPPVFLSPSIKYHINSVAANRRRGGRLQPRPASPQGAALQPHRGTRDNRLSHGSRRTPSTPPPGARRLFPPGGDASSALSWPGPDDAADDGPRHPL